MVCDGGEEGGGGAKTVNLCDVIYERPLRLLIEVGCMFLVSSSEAERSFSVLRRIKTHLRNQMGADRINVNESQY